MWVQLGRSELLILPAEHSQCVVVEAGPGLLWGGDAGLGATLQCVTHRQAQPITGQHYLDFEGLEGRC